MAWMAASQPPICPAQVWRGLAADSMSEDNIHRIAFKMMLRGTSPMPMGRTPGNLSKELGSRQRMRTLMRDQDLEDVHML